MLNNPFHNPTTPPNVELQPLNLISLLRIDNLVKAAGRQGRYHLDNTMSTSCPGKHHLSLRMTQLPQGGGGDVERYFALAPEHASTQVHLLHVHENARAEPDLVVRGVILSQGDLVVGTGAVVGPGGFPHDLLGNGLEIMQVEALSQRGPRSDALLSRFLIRVEGFLLRYHRGHVYFAEVLGPIEVLTFPQISAMSQ